jgi:2-iminobutanoate/2-iminopropanoate deaminase
MKKIISSPDAPKAVGPYSQAVAANGTLYISGQLPIDPATGTITGDNAAAQTEQCLKNIGAILAEVGGNASHVLKSTVLMADMNDFAAMNEVYARFYSEPFPARVAYQVARLPMGALIEIETIAAIE